MTQEYTNNQDLSSNLVQALSYSDYTKGECDFSATELQTPSRIIALTRRFRDQIVEDAADAIYRMFGTIGHSIIERTKKQIVGNNHELRTTAIQTTLETYLEGSFKLEELPERINAAVNEADDEAAWKNHNQIFERRFFATVDIDGIPVKISGQVDGFDNNIGQIRDYKITSRYATEAKDEWIKQLNVYAWLLRRNGFEGAVHSAKVEALFRDWSKSQAARDPNYPQRQVLVIDIELWDDDIVENYIIDRVRSHIFALSQAEEERIPVCTKEERWVKNANWAVTKHGRSRAIKLFDTEAEAAIWKAHNTKPGEQLIIEERKGESVRCKLYCPVFKFCTFGKYLI